MHDTALELGKFFFQLYGRQSSPNILDIGSCDVNGSLRSVAPRNSKYIGADVESGQGVDIVLTDPHALPFDDAKFDLVVSSSVFEHSQFFWLSFLEMVRVVKDGGFIYLNVPSNGFYHSYPSDNWRFYPDAGLALQLWAETNAQPLILVESFTARRKSDSWNDFVAVFAKGEKPTLPDQLLCDQFQDAFNIRNYRSPDVSNLEARTEDMLISDQLTQNLTDAKQRAADLEENALALSEELHNQLKSAYSEIDEWRTRAEQAEQENSEALDQLKALLDARIATSENLETLLAASLNDIDDVQRLYNQSKNEHSSQLAAKTEEVKAARAAANSLEIQLNEALERIELKNKLFGETTAKHASELATIQTQLTGTLAMSKGLEIQLAAARADVEHWKASLNEAGAAHATALDEARNQNKQLEIDLKQALSDKNEHSSQLAAKTEEVKAAHAAANSLEIQLNEALARIELKDELFGETKAKHASELATIQTQLTGTLAMSKGLEIQLVTARADVEHWKASLNEAGAAHATALDEARNQNKQLEIDLKQALSQAAFWQDDLAQARHDHALELKELEDKLIYTKENADLLTSELQAAAINTQYWQYIYESSLNAVSEKTIEFSNSLENKDRIIDEMQATAIKNFQEIESLLYDKEKLQFDLQRMIEELIVSKKRQGVLSREVSVAVRNLRLMSSEGNSMSTNKWDKSTRLIFNKYRRSLGRKFFKEESEVELMLRPLVDHDFYVDNNPDVNLGDQTALQHFIEHGWREKRNPNPWFDTQWYLAQNSDVAEANVNPLEHYVRHGWTEGRNPSTSFDVEFYLSHNDDVRADGREPLTHFILHGLGEGRLPMPVTLQPADSAPSPNPNQVADEHSPPPIFLQQGRYSEEVDRPRIALISSDTKSPSHVYRIDNPARGLTEVGCEVEIVPLHELWRIIDRVVDFHAVIFWRIAIGPRFGWSSDIERILSDCKMFGIATFFDVDDLVFDPSLCTPEYVDGLRYLDESERELYDEGVRGYRDLLLSCGQAIVTTSSLRQNCERFGVRTFVVPNGLDARYEDALDWPVIPHERRNVVIGYTPGTKTHQKDFAACAEALAIILEKYPQAQLRILGPLDLSEFAALESRLDTQVFLNPAVGRDRVFLFNQQIDINVIPLELDNPFTAAKSELKYFEAAVFGVPSVASHVGPYRDCIRNGENGFTASTVDEWVDNLSPLIENQQLRHKMGRSAREAVDAEYRAKPIARQMLEAIQAVRYDMHLKSNGEKGWTIEDLEEQWPDREGFQDTRPLKINWIIHGLLIGGGGHRMLLRAAHHLSRFGHHVRLYFTDTEHDPKELRELLHRHFFPIDCPIYVYSGNMKPADVVFATYWKTVDIALRHRDVCDHLMYFVQDFEPYFFAMGSDYIQSENTYRQGLYAITAGPWCAHFIRKQFQGEADHFVFPIESVYGPGERKKTNKNLVFFAKPEMPRRCYEIGVEVLKELHALRPDVELILFGSREVNTDNLPFPATCRSVLSVSELAQMYRDADVGLAFSPTNPSAVPYEMMACGLPVVDMARPSAEENYGGRFDLVKLADPVPSRMAAEIAALLDDPTERAKRSKAGLDFISDFPTEEEMGRRIETLVVSYVEKHMASSSTKISQPMELAAPVTKNNKADRKTNIKARVKEKV